MRFSLRIGTGLLVISKRNAGIVDQIKDGAIGSLVGEGDWEKLAERMIDLAKDAELRVKAGAFAREHVLPIDTANQVIQLEEVSMGAAKGGMTYDCKNTIRLRKVERNYASLAAGGP